MLQSRQPKLRDVTRSRLHSRQTLSFVRKQRRRKWSSRQKQRLNRCVEKQRVKQTLFTRRWKQRLEALKRYLRSRRQVLPRSLSRQAETRMRHSSFLLLISLKSLCVFRLTQSRTSRSTRSLFGITVRMQMARMLPQALSRV